MRKSIVVKVTGLLFLMLLVAYVNIATVYFFLEQQRHDAHIINVAGRQRMLTQRMSKLVLLVSDGDEASRKLLREAIPLYHSSLEALWHGGEAMGEYVPPAPVEMEALFQRNKDLWVPFKEQAQIVVKENFGSPAFLDAVEHVKSQNDPLLKISDSITATFDEKGSNKVLFLVEILLGLAVLDILFFILGYFVTRRIVRPLKELSAVAAKIGTGDFSVKAKVNSRDEVGDLADSFNKMTENLQAALRNEKEATAQALEAEAKKKQAEEFTQLKSHFVAIVSHEFLNPLSVIRESMSFILEGLAGQVTPEQDKILQTGKRSSDRLIRLVRNLLDLSKIESGKMVPKRESVDVAPLIEDAVTIRQKEMSDKGLTLYKNIQVGVGPVWADQDMLTQVIINLLNNAIKYTPSGGQIEVGFRQEGGVVRFEIYNTGPGIPKDYLEKVFDKFERIKAEKQEGTGLGLTITKDIIELHKGKIWVESEEGKGCKFIFTLPKDFREQDSPV